MPIGLKHLLTTLLKSSLIVATRLPVLLYRLFIEPPHNVQQGVARHDVSEGFGASLGVEGASDVVELTENVETIEHHKEFTFEEGTGEAGIPDEVVGVQQRVGIACSAVEAEIRREVELP